MPPADETRVYESIIETAFSASLKRQAAEQNRDSDAEERAMAANYQRQAIRQASFIFYLSLLAAVLGFAIIVIAGFKAIFGNSPPSLLSTITPFISGPVLSGVSFLFFNQANETRKRATELYDRLREDRYMSDAIRTAKSISQPSLRDLALAKIALKLAKMTIDPVNTLNLQGKVAVADASKAPEATEAKPAVDALPKAAEPAAKAEEKPAEDAKKADGAGDSFSKAPNTPPSSIPTIPTPDSKGNGNGEPPRAN